MVEILLAVPSSVKYCNEMLVSQDSDVAPSLSLYEEFSVLMEFADTSMVD